MGYDWHNKIEDLAKAAKAKKDFAKAEGDAIDNVVEIASYSDSFDVEWEASMRIVNDWKQHVQKLPTVEFHIYSKFAENMNALDDVWVGGQSESVLQFLLWYHAKGSLGCATKNQTYLEHQLAISNILAVLVQNDSMQLYNELIKLRTKTPQLVHTF